MVRNAGQDLELPERVLKTPESGEKTKNEDIMNSRNSARIESLTMQVSKRDDL